MSKINLLKWSMVILLLGIIAIGYGGLCTVIIGDKDKGEESGSSASAKSTISGQAYQQTSDNNMMPLGGATVTASYSDTTRSFGSPDGNRDYVSLRKSASTHSKTTRTKSDGSYEITDIPPDSVVTVTITSADTIQSTETITATAGVNNSSAILKGKGKKIGLIKKNQDSILNTFDDDTMPKCQVSIPADAVDSDVDNVYLTSTHQGENLSSLPDGYIFLAGADFSCPVGATSSPITFTSGKEATPYIILPPNVQAEDLSTADIRLMEFIDGNWVITTPSCKGKVHTIPPWRDYIGPDDASPAKLKGVRPWAWVAVQPSIATITGTIRNTSGTPIKGVFVFGGGAKTNTKSDGTYTLKNISVIKTNTLIPVNATADDYQLSNQFVSLSPGATVNNVDFILEPITVARLGEVYGKVTNAGDSSAIYGALLTLQTNPSIRGMKYDNKNTPTDLTDDTFYVVPPSGVLITNYKWMLTFPNGTKFNSTVENGASVVLNQLATESGINSTGAYKVELEVTYSGGNKTIVSGGFLLRQSGLVLYIADVRLPLSLQDNLTLKAMTNETGDYRFINLPTGETFNLWVKADGFIAPNTVQVTALTSGQRKQQNFPLSALTTDTQNPTNPSAFTGTARSPFSILLTWSASTDNVGIDYYRVYRGTSPVEIAKTTGTSYIDSGLTPNILYTYQIGAFDKANNSALSIPINVTTSSDTTTTDNTKPSTPTNLAATVIGPTQINLSWGASTDNVGVIGYKVYRSTDSTNYALRSEFIPPSAGLNATSYSDNGLSASTLYYYKVAAYDAADNISGYSNIVTGTTPAVADTTAPSVPSGITATTISSGQINLIWNPSTDTGGSGLAGYKVYRSTDGTNYQQLTTINSTSYSNSGLSASTLYYYKVSAYDGAGNTSAQSSAANATTQAAGGGGNQLIAHWKFDETSGTTANDSSGNGNNGTVYGPAWSGSALSFDGVDDYVNVGKSDIPPPWTAEFWVKRENSTFVSAALLSSSSYAIKLEQAFGTKKVGITRYNSADYVFNYEAPISSWVHLVFVCTPSDTKLFVNGNLQDTLPTSIYCPMGGIGREEGYSYSNYYKGLLDNIKIYNYARSAGEIQADYNASPIPAVDDYVWVANRNSNNVTRILKSNPAITATIAVGTNPFGVAVDETYCWVVNEGSNTVTRIQKSNSATTPIAVGSGPRGVAVDETYVWVTNYYNGFDGNSVTRITKSTLATINIAVGIWPIGVAVDETYCWVANVAGGVVTRITKSTLATTSIAVGGNLNGVAVDETYCWVSNYGSANVTRIQKSNPAISTTIAVGTDPYGVAVDETYCWVANYGSNNVTRITKSDSTTTNIVVRTNPFGVAVDETYCWVANYGSNNFTRILKSDITQKTTVAVGSSPYSLGDMTGYAYDNYAK